jgi:sortase (surface protein transpeptidase)
MPEGQARVLALTCAGVLSQLGMTLLLVGLSFGKSPPPAPPPAVQAAANAYAAADPAAKPAASATPSYVAALPRSRPVHLSIPRVGIETSLLELGLERDGTIEVPPDESNSPAGWYRLLASPGEAGTAVIVGHLDSPQAPAVFFNLGAMRPGDHLSVSRADGTTANFTVSEVGSYPRDQFPTDAVYGPSPTPVLRLVTCGGPFQRGAGYDGNIVVFADMDASPGLPPDAPAASPTPVDVPADAPGVEPAAPEPTPTPTPEPPTSTPETTTDSSTTDSSSEVTTPERTREYVPQRAPRRVRSTPPPVYVPPEAD